MPTKSELDELRNNCTWTWTTLNGIGGCKVSSKTNSNYIFLPAAGCRYNSNYVNAGSYGNYWASSLSKNYSNLTHYIVFNPSGVDLNYRNRYFGQSIRAVCP